MTTASANPMTPTDIIARLEAIADNAGARSGSTEGRVQALIEDIKAAAIRAQPAGVVEPVSRSAAQTQIDGRLAAQMIIDFQTAFSNVYGPDVMRSDLCAVGPLQSMIGLAILRGRLSTASQAVRIAELTRHLTAILAANDDYLRTFRHGPDDDPLTLACKAARAALAKVTPNGE